MPSLSNAPHLQAAGVRRPVSRHAQSTTTRRFAPVGVGRPEAGSGRAEARRERDAEIRALLEAALMRRRDNP